MIIINNKDFLSIYNYLALNFLKILTFKSTFSPTHFLWFLALEKLIILVENLTIVCFNIWVHRSIVLHIYSSLLDMSFSNIVSCISIPKCFYFTNDLFIVISSRKAFLILLIKLFQASQTYESKCDHEGWWW